MLLPLSQRSLVREDTLDNLVKLVVDDTSSQGRAAGVQQSWQGRAAGLQKYAGEGGRGLKTHTWGWETGRGGQKGQFSVYG